MSYGQSYNNYPAYGEQQSNPYGNNQGYGQNQYGQDVEMNPVQHPVDPNRLLNEIQKIKEGIRTLDDLIENRLAVAQGAMRESNSTREEETARQALHDIQQEISDGFRKLTDDLTRIKKTPGSGNVQAQLEVTTRSLGNAFEKYQKSQVAFSKQLKEQVRRQVAYNMEGQPQEEVERVVEAVLAGHQQAFQVSGARTQKARDAQAAVAERHRDIEKIATDLGKLNEDFQHLQRLVHEQEPAVQQIDQGAENVARDLGNANTQLGQAVESARKARRWKWYALIIVIIIIAIIVAVAVGVTQSK
ncbi:syntaxin [Aspergillus mulundensis]|uniref:t-SNARE coiled-coil homology domain-containing protein n=1 Tax=Aspergillus mulundensis TaxID=1810919 RepID=A0A3D8SLK9_9EURO|nr:Uncharacterized protein DSM5745_03794 [Aspergillus mulundensis]RDW87152.1 Uncharacterized protein DSM5745_03794 [Aspergillus mulundensis]